MPARDGPIAFANAVAIAGENDGYQQLIVSGRPLHSGSVAPPRGYLQHDQLGAGRVLEGFKRVLRLWSFGLCGFAALLPVKLVLRLLEVGWSDYLTLAFVIYVVVLFALLAVFMLLFLIAGPRAKRQRQMRFATPRGDDASLQQIAGEGLRLPAESAGSDQLQRIRQQLDAPPHAATEPLRVRGRLSGGAGSRAGELLLLDRWEERSGGWLRVHAAWPIALEIDNGPSLVVELETAAAVIAEYTASATPLPRELPSTFAAFGDNRLGEIVGEVQQASLRHGDQVEIIAFAQRSLNSLADAGLPDDEQHSYRSAGERVLSLCALPAHPIQLRKL